MAQFPGSIHDGAASIHTMVLNSRDTLLATGDNFGFVYLWNIDGYCVNKVEEKPAELLNMWRAHIESVTWLVSLVREVLSVGVVGVDVCWCSRSFVNLLVAASFRNYLVNDVDFVICNLSTLSPVISACF